MMRLTVAGFASAAALLFSACGSGGSAQTTVSEPPPVPPPVPTTYSVILGGSAAAGGPLCGATVKVAKLDGTVLYSMTTADYNASSDSTEYNATAVQLLPFADREAGKFDGNYTTSSVPNKNMLLLVTVTGGRDIDPDGDGFVETGTEKSFGGPLYAYATLGQLEDGNVSVNLLGSAAASVAAVRHLSVAASAENIETAAAEKLFKSDPQGVQVDYGTLTRFNPAVIENNTSADFAYLNDAGLYTVLKQSGYGAGEYDGNLSEQLRDTDNDGLIDAFEMLIGSNSALVDSDSDGVNDYAEVWAGTDPTNGSDAKNDTLYQYQWHLNNTGQKSGAKIGGTPGEDLDVANVRPQYDGSGNVLVAVVDSGVDSKHPDLKNNLDISQSYNYKYKTKDPGTSGAHGTCCAGLIGAQGYNGQGVRGVAPMARIAGLNVFSTGNLSDFVDALTRPAVDISSNSWGPTNEAVLNDWPAMNAAVAEGATNGREGKGTIYFFAAGNDRTTSHEGYANIFSLINTKYVITVSAVNAEGKLSSYSSTGANVLVAGTGGEYGDTAPAIVTTDQTGLNVGYDHGDTALDGNNYDGNYTRFMNGTSAATPTVAGIAALMLQANPDLTRRDVKYILAHTARENDPADGNWSLNGAGLHINDKFGFGVADATAAVTMAKSFTSLPQERDSSVYTDVADVNISDGDPNGVERTISVPDSIIIEHVDVWVTTDHPYIDDLRIVVTSPAGTQSVLAVGGEGHIPGTESYDNWRFGTERCMDENAQGTWKLKVIDTKTNGKVGSLTNWRIQISGH